MKYFGLLEALTAVLAGQNQASAISVFGANLDGSQENPGVTTSAFGSAKLVLNATGDQLSISIDIVGLDFGGQSSNPDDDLRALHIHNASAGTNGGVVFGMISPNHDVNPNNLVVTPSATGVGGNVLSVWDVPEGNGTTLTAQLSNLMSDGLYINAHTPGFLPGVIIESRAAIPSKRLPINGASS